jgi:type IV secretory pathway VirB3-like protein
MALRQETRAAVINAAGLTALIAFTGLVYLRTQEPLILIVGGLVSVVAVIGAMMGRG